MRRVIVSSVVGLGALLLTAVAAGEDVGAPRDDAATRIRIAGQGVEWTATLEDTPAARAFQAMLPLELTLEDYHGIEKVADLPSGIPTGDAPDGIDPAPGDITYYAPWGNLAIFYRDFRYARGLVRLGRIEGDPGALAGDGPIDVRIERVEGSR